MVHENSIAIFNNHPYVLDVNRQVYKLTLIKQDGIFSCSAEHLGGASGIIANNDDLYFLSENSFQSFKTGVSYPCSIRQILGRWMTFVIDESGLLRKFQNGTVSNPEVSIDIRVAIGFLHDIVLLDIYGKLFRYEYAHHKLQPIPINHVSKIDQIEVIGLYLVIRCGLNLYITTISGDCVTEIKEAYPCSSFQRVCSYIYVYHTNTNVKKIFINSNDEILCEEIPDSRKLWYVFTINDEIFGVDDNSQFHYLKDSSCISNEIIIARELFYMTKSARSSLSSSSRLFSE